MIYYQYSHTSSLDGLNFLQYGGFSDPQSILNILPDLPEAFFSYIQMVYGLLHQIELPLHEIKTYLEDSASMYQQQVFYDTLFQQRESHEHDYTYQDELQLLHHIREGDVSNALLAATKIAKGRIGKTSENHVRRNKYAVISAIVLMTRHVIDVDVPIEIAFNMSDTYITRVDEEYDSHHLFNLFLDAVHDYCALVKAYQHRDYPLWIKKCTEYINQHLHEPISLMDLSHHIHMAPAYISVQFKRIHGDSIKEYTAKQRIYEAKYLLTHTSLTIQEIAVILCFNDQSYFTKVFKHYAKQLPTTYRMEHKNVS